MGAMGMASDQCFAQFAAGRHTARFFAMAFIAVCLLFVFPILWLILTSLRPVLGVYYFIAAPITLGNFAEVLRTTHHR